MQIATALSTDTDFDTACREAAARAREDLGDADVDICLVFVSSGYHSRVQGLPVLMTSLVDPTRLVGCASLGAIGGGIEVQELPAVSVTLLSIPDSDYECVHLIDQDLPDPDAGPADWVDLLHTQPEDANGILLLGDPFSFDTERLLVGLDYAYPNTPKVGGLTSGDPSGLGNSLFLDQTTYHEGAVAVTFSGRVGLSAIVAQGCRPFGKVGRITKADGTSLLEVDGVPALQFLNQQLQQLSPRDLELAQATPLYLGIASDPFAVETPAEGEFLIRSIMGYNQDMQMVAVGAELAVGRQVQFHLRDGAGSSKDLHNVLEKHVLATTPADPRAQGGILFSCIGRGEHLFDRPNHDSEVFFDVVGRMPLGGFFCGGEIGPVQGATHLHGFSAAFALFHESES